MKAYAILDDKGKAIELFTEEQKEAAEIIAEERELPLALLMAESVDIIITGADVSAVLANRERHAALMGIEE